MRLVNLKPGRAGAIALGAAPILLLLLVYIFAAGARDTLVDSPRIIPTPGEMVDAFARMATQPDPRTGVAPLWSDTAASLARLAGGLAIAVGAALAFGLAMGLAPMARAAMGPLAALASIVPPVAILPILFITLGLGEASKIALIAIGVAPVMIRDLSAHISAIPREEIIKAQTLGAGTWQILLKVGLPRLMPRLIASLRLALGPALVYLITAEAIASDVGLGYRIFLVRRFFAMDVILPYVVWITLLAIILDFLLARLARGLYPWAGPDGAPR